MTASAAILHDLIGPGIGALLVLVMLVVGFVLEARERERKP